MLVLYNARLGVPDSELFLAKRSNATIELSHVNADLKNAQTSRGTDCGIISEVSTNFRAFLWESCLDSSSLYEIVAIQMTGIGRPLTKLQ